MRLTYRHNGEFIKTGGFKMVSVIKTIADSIPVVMSSNWVQNRQYMTNERFRECAINLINKKALKEGKLSIDTLEPDQEWNWTRLIECIDRGFIGMKSKNPWFANFEHPTLGDLKLHLSEKTPEDLFCEIMENDHKRTLACAKAYQIRGLKVQREIGYNLPFTNDYNKLLESGRKQLGSG